MSFSRTLATTIFATIAVVAIDASATNPPAAVDTTPSQLVTVTPTKLYSFEGGLIVKVVEQNKTYRIDDATNFSEERMDRLRDAAAKKTPIKLLVRGLVIVEIL